MSAAKTDGTRASASIGWIAGAAALAALLTAALGARAQDAPALACGDGALVRTVRAGETATPLVLACTNAGDATLSYALADDADWLAVAPRAVASLAPGATAEHKLRIGAGGLAPGRHDALVVARGGAAELARVPVTLVVMAADAPAPWALGPGSQPPDVAADPGVRARFPAFAQEPIVRLLHSQDEATSCNQCHIADDGSADPISAAWRGSMMAHASRDPLLWAALAVAERAVPGIGDTCLRCHVAKGWLEGRSVPSTGAALLPQDADGVTCQLCHRMAEPSGAEPGAEGEQSAPFAALRPDGGGPLVGNAFFSIFQDAAEPDLVSRLGPYDIPFLPFHPVIASPFQRDAALCGTCHDVSNPVVGDHAPSHGALPEAPVDEGFSGDPQGDLAATAAFRLAPHAYGVEQRTYSEWAASAFATLAVSDFPSLPAELRAPDGAIARAHRAALGAGLGGDYADGTRRLYTCQSCHMPPANDAGCRFALPRPDLPQHEFVGGNHWAPDAIRWLDDAGRYETGAPSGLPSRLRLGGGLDDGQWQALAGAPARAADALRSAVVLATAAPRTQLPNTLRVVNLTGHKLPSGYPDGRRMWLRVRWRAADGALVAEEGRYGDLAVDDLDGDGAPDTVRTLLDPDARVYEARLGVSREWARCLVAARGASCAEDPRLRGLGLDPALPLAFAEGGGVHTLGELAAAAPGTVWPTHHLALNDQVLSDTRIPPYGLRFEEARRRNALPVPAGRYRPAPGAAVYDHFDEVALAPPPGAVRAEVALLYQTTSYEYVRFLADVGGDDPFLDGAGADLLAAWRATGMAEPVEMARLAVPEPGGALVAAAVAASLGWLARRGRAPCTP